MLSALSLIYGWALAICRYLPGIAFGLVMLLVATDVAMRNFGFSGILWSIEVVEYALLAATFLGASAVLHADRHVSIDIVTNALPNTTRRPVEFLARLVTFAVSVGITLVSWMATYRTWQDGSILIKTIILPEWLPLIVVSVGLTMLSVVAGLKLVRPQLERNNPTSAI